MCAEIQEDLWEVSCINKTWNLSANCNKTRWCQLNGSRDRPRTRNRGKFVRFEAKAEEFFSSKMLGQVCGAISFLFSKYYEFTSLELAGN
jgi:hypothetical protein